MKLMQRLFSRLYVLLMKLHQSKLLSDVRSKTNVKIHSSFRMGAYAKITIRNSTGALQIGAGVSCRRFFSLLVFPEATCIIGNNVFFNNGCSLTCLNKIEIGENTIFGESVKIYDHNHKFQRGKELKVERADFDHAPIVIGRNCWIGSNVTILKGVTIGDNVIIGANCLIYKAIPSNSIVKHSEELIVEALQPS